MEIGRPVPKKTILKGFYHIWTWLLSWSRDSDAANKLSLPYPWWLQIGQADVPVNNFSVMSGRSHRFLGIASAFWEVNVSCSRIQHGDLSEDRTPTSRYGFRRSITRPPRLRLKLWTPEQGYTKHYL